MELGHTFYIESFYKERILRVVMILKRYEIFSIEKILQYEGIYKIKVRTKNPREARQIIWSEIEPRVRFSSEYDMKVYGYLVQVIICPIK